MKRLALGVASLVLSGCCTVQIGNYELNAPKMSEAEREYVLDLREEQEAERLASRDYLDRTFK